MQNRRRCERKNLSKPVYYSVCVLKSRKLKKLDMKGTAFDMCDKGMSMFTDYPLSPGQVLIFNNGIGPKIGTVKWNMQLEENKYKVGITFSKSIEKI